MEETAALGQIYKAIEAQTTFETQQTVFIAGYVNTTTVPAKIALLNRFNTLAYKDYPEERTDARRYFNSINEINNIFTHLQLNLDTMPHEQREVTAGQTIVVLNTCFPDWAYDLRTLQSIRSYGSDVLHTINYNIWEPGSLMYIHRLRSNYTRAQKTIARHAKAVEKTDPTEIEEIRREKRQTHGFNF